MAERKVISHILLRDVISFIINIIDLLITTGLIFSAGVLYGANLSSPGINRPFLISAIVFGYVFFLFLVAYSVVTIIGTTLWFSDQDRQRKIGFVMLIVVNSILVPFSVVNCAMSIAAFIILPNDPSTLLAPPILGIVASACPCVPLGYGIFHIIWIRKSF